MDNWNTLSSLEFYFADTALNLLRYLLVAGGTYLIAWKWLRSALVTHRIQETSHKPQRLRAEFSYSISTAFIFGIVGFVIALLGKAGLLKIYFNVSDYGWPYLLVSLVAALLIHDAYFYWMHRLLHHPQVFKRIHQVHHLSTNPSPLAAYAFHPVEAVFEALFFPLMLMLLPLHVWVVITFTALELAYNVLGHFGYEFYPKGFTKHPIGQWINTATHHNMHHQHFNANFGLYFNIWDSLCGTNHPHYQESFKNVCERRDAAR